MLGGALIGPYRGGGGGGVAEPLPMGVMAKEYVLDQGNENEGPRRERDPRGVGLHLSLRAQILVFSPSSVCLLLRRDYNTFGWHPAQMF